MLSEGVAAKYYSKILRQLVTGLGYCLIFSFMLREIYLLVPEVLEVVCDDMTKWVQWPGVTL